MVMRARKSTSLQAKIAASNVRATAAVNAFAAAADDLEAVADIQRELGELARAEVERLVAVSDEAEASEAQNRNVARKIRDLIS